MAQNLQCHLRVDMNEMGDPYTSSKSKRQLGWLVWRLYSRWKILMVMVWTITKTLDAGFYGISLPLTAGPDLGPWLGLILYHYHRWIFTNRFVDVTGDVALDTVCYGACTTCSEAVTYDITFM